MGLVLGATAAAALLLAAAFESVKKDAASNGELDKFASGLRLTDEQVRKAGGSVKYLSDRTREVTGITVTWGNIASATYQVLLERAGTTSKGISDGFTSAFKWIGDFGKFTISLLLAGFAGLIELVMSVGKNLGRLATGNFDQLTNPLKDVQKQFYKTFNDVEAKPKKVSDHGLADALAELDAQIRGQKALAAAYQVSDAAAIKAAAMQKAEEQAIRHKGEIGVFYEKELALAVASRAADSAKEIADIHAEAAARAVVNDLVEQGIIPVQRMSAALEEQQKKRQLMAALAVAEDKGWLKQAADLRDEIANLAFTQADLNDLLAKEAALRQQDRSRSSACGPSPSCAAMVAVIASLGFKGGGWRRKAPRIGGRVQAAQGTGTVLGSPNAQSESISHSLELVAANTNKSLEYFNPMLRSLRSIDQNIGALAAQVAKELQLGGAFDTTGKLGTTSKGIPACSARPRPRASTIRDCSSTRRRFPTRSPTASAARPIRSSRR
jgi:hypothetical protein